ncbi:unnamed protein product [Auanema sp. JU1783]|nr:unnamed protein product [Auanema sp. JU1783]
MYQVLWSSLFLFSFCTATELRTPDNVFARGELDYRNLVLDSNSGSLYVGARSRIYRLWAYNINDTSKNLFAEKHIALPESELSECRSVGNSDADCQPSTRFMTLQDQKETLYICSSVAMKPEIRVLDASTLKDRQDPRTEIGICSSDPMVNSTAVLVEWGNPGEIPSIYSGIRTGMAGENHLIYRPSLISKGKEAHSSMRTVYTDSKWLNEPQFVGSFDIGEYVYFFFREISVESGLNDRIIRSRVARVCKKDTGGRAVLRQVWTSFVKARLNCSISAQYPYYFDHIQSITRVESVDDTLFYAGMSTSDTAFQTSAICVYSLKSINQLFHNGAFMESSGANWLPLPPDAVPAHRPGTCVSSSQELSDSDLHFAKSHLLMAEPISGDVPIIPTRDVVFSTILVDVRTEQNVIFAFDGRKEKMWKISHWKEGNQWKSSLVEHRDIVAGGQINAAALLPGEFFFTATSHAVSQFTLSSCSLHKSCALCAVDPYCSWNTARDSCHPREKVHSKNAGWISSWAGRGTSDCMIVTQAVRLTHYPSDSIHMKGHLNCQWNKDDSIVQKSERTIMTDEGGLILLDASGDDSGNYECRLDNKSILKYRLKIETEECALPRTVEAYKSCWLNHCKRRNEHDFAQRIWMDQKNKVTQCHINESDNANRVD